MNSKAEEKATKDVLAIQHQVNRDKDKRLDDLVVAASATHSEEHRVEYQRGDKERNIFVRIRPPL